MVSDTIQFAGSAEEGGVMGGEREASSWVLPVLRPLVLIGLGVSGYLVYLSVTGGGAAGCSGRLPPRRFDRVYPGRRAAGAPGAPWQKTEDY